MEIEIYDLVTPGFEGLNDPFVERCLVAVG